MNVTNNFAGEYTNLVKIGNKSMSLSKDFMKNTEYKDKG